MNGDDAGPALSPVQQRVLLELLDPGGIRPSFDPDLHRRLLNRIRAGSAGAVESLMTAGQHLDVNKYVLDQVHACERHYRAERDVGFSGWTPARARGVVAHQAIALGIFSRPPRPPLDLVDDTLARFVADDDPWTPGAWLRDEASAAETAELRAGATAVVSMFEECFPPIAPGWRPRVETALTVRVVTDALTLRAKPDLVLGKAEGNVARSLVIDFKTGRPAAAHLDDARFYALVVALRTGVPPFRSASFYLDGGDWLAVDITEDDLETAARRVVDGVERLTALAVGEREPRVSPGPACNFCVIRSTCDRAFAHLAAGDDGDGGSETPF